MPDLHSIASWLPADILRKGEGYWAAKLVDQLANEGHNWRATVNGSEPYSVEIRLDESEVQEWSCDCPYDWGPVCKHVAAVLIAIRNELTETEEPAAKTATGAKSAEEIIQKLDAEEMRRILQLFADRSQEVEAHLLAKYGYLLKKVSKKQYEELIQGLIDTHDDGQFGFIEYEPADRLGKQLFELVKEADFSHPMAVIYLSEEVIRQIGQVSQRADDSSGSLGVAMDKALQNLFQLADERRDTPAKVLKHILNYAIKESDKEEYQGWDWPVVLRAVAAKAARTKLEAEGLIHRFERSMSGLQKTSFDAFELEHTARLKLDLLERFYPNEEAEVYLLANLSYTSFRERAIERALENDQLEKAQALAQEGITQDQERDLPGLVDKWQKWLTRLQEEADSKST